MLISLMRGLAGLLFLLFAALAGAAPLSTAVEHDAALGLSTDVLVETDGRLGLPEAMAAFKAGKFTPGNRPVLNFGIGSKPVWIRLAVNNPDAGPADRRMSIETAWLDRIDAYFLHNGLAVGERHVGDRLPFSERPRPYRLFVFDHVFEPGASEVFLRIETPDPMVVPLYLLSREGFQKRLAQLELSYGIVYGFLLALMAYNAILYASLRSARYLFYSIYLALFVAMNVAYTGHGFAWLWPDSLAWQQWSNPVLMFLYGAAGLLFANRFLEMRQHFPRVRQAVFGFLAVFGGLLAVAVVAGAQEFALLVAFTFAFLFCVIMLVLGALAVHAGQRPAKYFLIAAFSAMTGALLTTLAVWGKIPFNGWTYRAVEIGMLIDATLLALALALQLRVSQERRIRAERLAQLDPLTGLNNRRAFYDQTVATWSNSVRHDRDVSVMLFDIDKFKQINDVHGHAHGDAVLKAIAAFLKQSVREGDVAARWGGEEFIVFMSDTHLKEAVILAERLREAVMRVRVPHEGGVTTVTASFGVAQRLDDRMTLDDLIARADDCLYQSKQQGRNRVTYRLDTDDGV